MPSSLILDDLEQNSSQKVPRHIAIIMDGNGRWAQSRHLPRIEGHRAGAKTVHMVVEECRKIGVKYLTLFTFSTENWKRPVDEVSSLMRLLEVYLRSELEKLLSNGIRLRSIGDLTKLPSSVRGMLAECEKKTESLEGMQLILALSYGGREEILNAVQRIAKKVREGDLEADGITHEEFERNLYAPDIPDPDLLIRTSGELRISNFLLWQLAYSEIVVSKMFWPEFSKEEFHKCLSEYKARERRFGLTGEQIESRRNGS
ncbi:MAG: isoprenyl transferase [SAR324 cluster bacterium]|uniref:Isoprenyl transferase n=1 Tax=SAR324 cluster bacterium TaxID=2024889 RepID=A0A7X9IJ82_9DELT|nr:isoprenyl transferase [SAR324 cluster bacterium]